MTTTPDTEPPGALPSSRRAAAGRVVALGARGTDLVMSRLRRPAGEARLRAAVEAAKEPVKINVGSGTVRLPGWFNTDVRWRSEWYLDLTRPWPVPAGKVSHIFADQVIEHFTLETGRLVLRHAYDALAPGGTIRLSTPDVERTVHLYLAADATANEHLARHRRRGYAAEYPVDLLRVTFGENGHRFCYDLHALRTELERAGFVTVRRVEVHASVDPALRGLEARSSPTEALTTLVVEADRSRAGGATRSSAPH